MDSYIILTCVCWRGADGRQEHAAQHEFTGIFMSTLQTISEKKERLTPGSSEPPGLSVSSSKNLQT